jgi:hypothetical protein
MHGIASALPWSSVSSVPRSVTCAPPLAWWICAFHRGHRSRACWGSMPKPEPAREKELGPLAVSCPGHSTTFVGHCSVLVSYAVSSEGPVRVGYGFLRYPSLDHSHHRWPTGSNNSTSRPTAISPSPSAAPSSLNSKSKYLSPLP